MIDAVRDVLPGLAQYLVRATINGKIFVALADKS